MVKVLMGWVARIPLYVGERPSSNSVNDLRRTGRAIVYQLINKNGQTDPQKTFDLAVFFGKITLTMINCH